MAEEEGEAWQAWHGHGGSREWALPRLVAESGECNRADQGNRTLANEYMDLPDVLEKKVDAVVALLRQSKHTVAYTGAGLSKASGIPDYATKAKDTVVKAPS
eukprot:TRINITY_DN10921_c0_g2_i1.p1 TRINITY_DN10921_c0_g2~~TRINITY_DN10921_c0_g2_i1.p1  ORF type:complete len:115 (+),score=35.23 TRINITY_DN10921_c0_g2_i1:41-346(+)